MSMKPPPPAPMFDVAHSPRPWTYYDDVHLPEMQRKAHEPRPPRPPRDPPPEPLLALPAPKPPAGPDAGPGAAAAVGDFASDGTLVC